MLKKISTWLLILGLLPAASFAALEEGVDYDRIIPEQPTDSAGKIEVVELFWYGCPHCHRFQPYMERWARTLPADVSYRRMPAILGEHWAIGARAFYTAEALGVLEKIHMPLFEAIHNQKRRLDSEDSFADFFAEHGVKKEDFRKAFNSFAVDAKVRRTREMGNRYRVNSTPSVVVNGKYILNPQHAGGDYNKMIKIINELIEKERKGS